MSADGPLLVLGAGYIGSKVAELALERGEQVILADNWQATRWEQLVPLETHGARVVEADIRRHEDLDRLLQERPSRVILMAAQASRPLSWELPDYTEETNLTGARRVAEAVVRAGGMPLVYGSSLHVYGPSPEGEVGPDHPYGEQGDLAHLSKIYAELMLKLYARRYGFGLSLLRLGIVYGPSVVEHPGPESQTVVDKFRRLVASGEPPTVEGGGTATIGVVHVEDAGRIVLDAPRGQELEVENVVAETVTVADVAAYALGEPPRVPPSCTYASPFEYTSTLAGYFGR